MICCVFVVLWVVLFVIGAPVYSKDFDPWDLGIHQALANAQLTRPAPPSSEKVAGYAGELLDRQHHAPWLQA